ncbi:helix-turn-helix domain-containing protein [Streptococcus hillyeri]|uniref:Rgg/GadR/MutR family transcriptional regulator n=1 Tax=Streptococcus hillyeri TaxID=2282420 RepID=A0A3L9DR54_9STRE|nr:Rgg/GadR/MutR family transcriptional regulator [Streptococcus hillyeri]RLY02119.1 Rgg/GadR/MutR family transcriptional regulator [Streptococcus hillyeri]
MKKFGEIFKKFRESRGLRLKDVAKAGISISQLSRFEKGETDLTISKFMAILDEINMPIDEFMYAVHDFHRDELNELLSKVRHFVSTHDIEGMKKLLYSQMESENKRGKFYQLNMILLKIRLQDLSGEAYYNQKDLDDLTDYLFSVEYWGYYELLIFSNTLDVLKHDVFMVLAREMIRRSDFYKEIPNNRRLISTMLLNGYITCIERGKLLDALYFEKQLNQCFFIETEIYERLVFQYAKHFYDYRESGNQDAIVGMQKCIEAMVLAGSDQLAQIYRKHLDKL